MPALFVDALKFKDGKPVAFGISDMSSTGTPARSRVLALLEHRPAQPVALARCICPTGRLSHLLYQTMGDNVELFVKATRRPPIVELEGLVLDLMSLQRLVSTEAGLFSFSDG